MRYKNYYRKYRECPDCGKKSIDNKVYFRCKDSDCGYVEKQYIRVQKEEEEIREIIEDMVETCILTNTPLVNYSGSALLGGDICAGWYDPKTNRINVPRKASTLPRKQLTDTVGHECGHADPEATEKDLLNAEENALKGWYEPIEHGPAWYEVYINNYNLLNVAFAVWINKSHKVRYSLEEEIPNPISDYRKDLKYDPYEDD